MQEKTMIGRLQNELVSLNAQHTKCEQELGATKRQLLAKEQEVRSLVNGTSL